MLEEVAVPTTATGPAPKLCCECEGPVIGESYSAVCEYGEPLGPLCEPCSHHYRCRSCGKLEVSVSLNPADLCESCQFTEDAYAFRELL